MQISVYELLGFHLSRPHFLTLTLLLPPLNSNEVTISIRITVHGSYESDVPVFVSTVILQLFTNGPL